MTELGRLVNVDPRENWKHEALDFTSWLASKDGLQLLSYTIGINLIEIKTEEPVGDFRTDILAEAEGMDKFVVIENQLGESDHDHLGKILTYASGHNAGIVIWICTKFRKEHRSAIQWLNNHTDEEINFFALEIELLKIDDSRLAPNFKVIESPNDWVKRVKSAQKNELLTETEMSQQEYWKKFQEYATSRKTELRLREPRPRHWYDISLGSSQAHIALTVDSKRDVISCTLYINSNRIEPRELLKSLLVHKAEIEAELGVALNWEFMDKTSKHTRSGIELSADFSDEKDQERQFDWLLQNGEHFVKVFNKWLRIVKNEPKSQARFS